MRRVLKRVAMAEKLERHVLHCHREQLGEGQLPACRGVDGEKSALHSKFPARILSEIA
jgi:hypothetical protein